MLVNIKPKGFIMNEKYKSENSASTQSEISLSDMKVGDKGKIRAITATAEIRRRLLDMGLVKGVKFKVVRVAPLGDHCGWFVRCCADSARRPRRGASRAHRRDRRLNPEKCCRRPA